LKFYIADYFKQHLNKGGGIMEGSPCTKLQSYGQLLVKV